MCKTYLYKLQMLKVPTEVCRGVGGTNSTSQTACYNIA